MELIEQELTEKDKLINQIEELFDKYIEKKNADANTQLHWAVKNHNEWFVNYWTGVIASKLQGLQKLKFGILNILKSEDVIITRASKNG